MNNLILEDGYNTDYIYSLIIALFYTPCDGLNKIINIDASNSNTYYLQEFIKSKFIYPMHRNMSIESCQVNKLRVFMYNCGWHKNDDKDILDKGDLDKFYNFIMNNMMEYNLQIVKIDPLCNSSKIDKLDMIRITDKHIDDKHCVDFMGEKMINLSFMIRQWVKESLVEEVYSYKFETIPFIIPVLINIRDVDTGLNKICINIMQGLNFEDNGDKIQRMFIWEIHSMICQTNIGDYYTIIIDHNDDFVAFSDKQIPSNWKIDNSNHFNIKKIMKEVRFIFYKLQ